MVAERKWNCNRNQSFIFLVEKQQNSIQKSLKKR